MANKAKEARQSHEKQRTQLRIAFSRESAQVEPLAATPAVWSVAADSNSHGSSFRLPYGSVPIQTYVGPAHDSAAGHTRQFRNGVQPR